jgi:hypothetical protein
VKVAAEVPRSSVEGEWHKFLLPLSHLPAPGLNKHKCTHKAGVTQHSISLSLSHVPIPSELSTALEKLLDVWLRIEILILILAMTV